MPTDPNSQNATEIQTKFDFYFVALIFTILGLAIQTTEYNENSVIAAFEIASWIFLLGSGLIAIKRLMWIPVIFHTFSAINKKEKTIEQIKTHIQAGGTPLYEDDEALDLPSSLKKLKQDVKELEKISNEKNRNGIKLFKLQWTLFILALVFVILSRGFESLSLIYFTIRANF